MKNRVWAFAIPAVILLAAFLVPSLLTSQSAVMDKPSKEDVAHKMQRIQIPFVANNGQVDAQVKFYANTFGGTVFVTKDGEIVYSLPNNSSESDGRRQRTESNPKSAIQNLSPTSIGNLKSGVAIKETLVGGRVQEITGNEKAVTKVSYFKGNDPSQWKTNISTYDVVSLGEVYDGIELKLKAYGNNVEKLFRLKSGANPEQIKISLSGIQPSGNPPPLSPSVRGTGGCPPLAGAGGGLGASLPVRVRTQTGGLWVNEHGQLVAETELGPVKFTKPIAYQEINGKRVDVECKYTIADCGMQNADCKTNPKSEIRNSSSTSIGDPQLEYGFTVASYDKTKDLIIDPLLASTYLGGSGSDYRDYGNSLALDTSGNVYMTGTTYWSDFPTTSGAYDTSLKNGGDVFVSKLNSGLTSLLASTYLGGSGGDYGYSLTLDTSGNVYVTGDTRSTDFPTTSDAYDTSYNGDNRAYYGGDVFVSKLDGELTSLLASTYLGGSSDDWGYSLTLDTSGNVYVAGETYSANFPTTSGAYNNNSNGSGFNDVFVSKLDGGLTRLLASTYLGVGGGRSLTLDTSGNVYVTGDTLSTGFPTTSGAYDTSKNGSSGYDVFVSKLDGGLTSLLASTYLGGFYEDKGYSIAIDTSGNVYVTGETRSTNFPMTSGAYDTSFNGSDSDVFVSKLDGNLSASPPAVTTGNATNVTSSSAKLNGTLNANGLSTTAWFNYGTSAGSYNGTSTTQSVSGSSDTLVSIGIGELSPGTTYYYRIAAQNITGITYGDEMSFITLSDTSGSQESISGYVIDIKGNPIGNAKVRLKRGNIAEKTVSDEDGFFEFEDLDAGTYVVIVRKRGYKISRKTVKLKDNEDIKIEIKMKKQ